MDRPDDGGLILQRAVSPNGIRVEVPYPGGFISVNRYKWQGGRYTKPEAVAWRDMLATQVRLARNASGLGEWTAPTTWVYMECWFADRRHPDPSNLWKLALDGIAQGLGVDDKGFRERVAKIHVHTPPPRVAFYILPGRDQAALVEGAQRWLSQQAQA